MKAHSPSAERNRDEILAVLPRVLPREGTLLEIASGSGQHAIHFAPHFPDLVWQPTDRDPDALASVRAWRDEAGLPNLRPPLELDVTWPTWPVEAADAIFCSNMLHISPWEACQGLLSGAARTLSAGGRLVYYGALIRADRETAPSNLAFDQSLRARNLSWGVRPLEAILAEAGPLGLALDQVIDMPNNNFLLVLARR